MSNVTSLPFDQYQRYRLASDLLAEVRDGARLRVLDVGGRTALLREFLPDDNVVLVNVEASDAHGLVLGDGGALPFADGAFDAVFAFDTLEHVPPAARAAFVGELARVARRWVMVAGPYAAPEVDQAERLLLRFLREKLGVEHRYLEEHRHNGLPARADVERVLAQGGASVASVGHGNVRRWLALMGMALYLDYDPRLRDLAREVYRYYNERLYEDDDQDPVYRHVVVGAFDGAHLPRGRARARKPRAGAETAPLVELAFDLIGFDRARDDAREENRKLWSSNDSLRQDLEGHKGSLVELAQREREQRAVIDRLREELARHAQETLAIERAAKRRELEEEKARAELAHALDEHRREVAALRERLAAEQTAHADASARADGGRDELAQALERERGAGELVAALRAELERHARETLATEREVGARAAEEAAVRAELGRELALARAELTRLGELVRHEQAARAREQNALDQERARLEHLRVENEARRTAETALAEDLAGHRAALGEARLELARQAGELALRGELLAQRERGLDELRAHAGELERRLAEREAHGGELARVLAEREERIRALELRVVALETALRDRVGNLKRALGRKRPQA